MNSRDIIEGLEQLAPVKYAESWDNSGLLVGRLDQKVSKIMIALDATEEVIDQCILNNIDLLITHHPLIFSPIKNVTWDTVAGRKIMKLIKNDIACYAIHTNFDVMVMAKESADKLGLCNQRVLDVTFEEEYYKLVVFVPFDSVEKVRTALTRAGAGYIGNYSDCTFSSEGTGTFRPLEGTNPYIGHINELEKVNEVKIETIIKKDQKNSVIQAMLRAHPYEEVAYDIYPLKNSGTVEGIGRYGYLSEDMKLSELAQIVKQRFHLSHVTVTGDLNHKVASVAISTGAGKSMIKYAKKAKVDVLITGDMDHHTALDAREEGLMIIDAGHFGTEHFMVEYTKRYIHEYLYHCEKNYVGAASDIQVMTAKEESPFQVI